MPVAVFRSFGCHGFHLTHVFAPLQARETRLALRSRPLPDARGFRSPRTHDSNGRLVHAVFARVSFMVFPFRRKFSDDGRARQFRHVRRCNSPG